MTTPVTDEPCGGRGGGVGGSLNVSFACRSLRAAAAHRQSLRAGELGPTFAYSRDCPDNSWRTETRESKARRYLPHLTTTGDRLSFNNRRGTLNMRHAVSIERDCLSKGFSIMSYYTTKPYHDKIKKIRGHLGNLADISIAEATRLLVIVIVTRMHQSQE